MGTFVNAVLAVVCLASFAACEAQTTVHKLAFRSDIQFRFATTEVTCVMSNDGNKSHELTFDVTLPKQAFIANFSMEIEGKVYPGNVKEKQQARKDYLEARQLGHTGGLVEQKPRHSNQFEVSVNIEAGHNVTFSLFYQELLRRRLGTYEHSVHIDNRADIKELSVEVFIQERTEIQNVRTPALRKDIINNAVDEGTNTMTIISQPTPSTAHVVYQPTPGQVKEAGGGWFVVQYDVTSESAGDMMVVDGYFVHYFVPPSDLPPLPLDIVFVLDMSGSMSGTPIKQLREAMSIILDDLRPTDRFSIILFDDRVQYWQNRLQEASPSKVEEAQQFVKTIEARGSTDLHLGLTRGLSMLKVQGTQYRVPMLFFLTDGEATAGIQNSELIVQKVTELNKGDDSKAMANIYGLAFGGGADYRLLKQVSAKNNGFARKIYEGADATLQVSGLYKEIATVVLRALSIEYHSSTSDQGGRDVVRVNNSTVTVCGFSALYGQADAVVAGKLDNMDLLQPGETAGLEVVVSGQGLDGQKVNLVLNENDITDLTLSGKGENPFWSVPRNLAKITERAWAYLTIQQLLEQKVAAAEDKNLVKELDAKILDMSLKYHFVTPLTSMVVTRPEDGRKKGQGEDEGKGPAYFDDEETRRAPPRVQPMMSHGLAMQGRQYSLASYVPAAIMPGLAGPGGSGPPRRPTFTHQKTQHRLMMRTRPTLPSMTRIAVHTSTSATMMHSVPWTTTTLPPGGRRGTGKGRGGKGKGGKKGSRGKKHGKKTKTCVHNKKVLLDALIVRGQSTGLREACAELRSGREPAAYTLLQSQDGSTSLFVNMTKKFVNSIGYVHDADAISVYVASNGSLAYDVISGRLQVIDVDSSKQTQLVVRSSLFDVTISVTKSRCKKTWLSIDVTQKLELSDHTGVIVDMMTPNAATSRRGRRQRQARRRRSKPSKSCTAAGVSSAQSSILSFRKLKRHVIKKQIKN